jgi:DNA uptake protein ComE-like DNA-binding protein
MIFHSEKEVSVSFEDLKQVAELRKLKESRSTNSFNKKNKQNKYKIPPNRFNPNDYTVEQWRALGLSVKQVNVIMKFTKRGVYRMEDFEKIFVIPNELFLKMKDSLIFSERFPEKTYTDYAKTEKKVIRVELNSSSKEEIMELPGVGAYIAERIVNMRERLGGFILKEQLLEIKKIDLELYNKIENLLLVDRTKIIRLNINTASAEELKNHPYLNWNIANSIVKMRVQKGGTYKNLEELLDSVLIDRELFEKIKPYLSL